MRDHGPSKSRCIRSRPIVLHLLIQLISCELNILLLNPLRALFNAPFHRHQTYGERRNRSDTGWILLCPWLAGNKKRVVQVRIWIYHHHPRERKVKTHVGIEVGVADTLLVRAFPPNLCKSDGSCGCRGAATVGAASSTITSIFNGRPGA